MQTKTKEIQQPTTEEALAWLKGEYITKDGRSLVELIYIDYRDSFDENVDGLMEVLRQGHIDDESWMWDCQGDNISQIIGNYVDTLPEDTELSDETREAMVEWLQENDTSKPYKQLLRNTGHKLFFLDTSDYVELGDDWENKKEMIQKYAKTEEQKNEIEYLYCEAFYNAPLSFYFYADVEEVYNAIHNSKESTIIVDGAYIANIDRVQGSNWIGNNAVFRIAIPREQFIKALHADKEKGTGYGWDRIAGQNEYTECAVYSLEKLKDDMLLIDPIESESLKRERKLDKKWNNGRGTCTLGDMNWNRHKEKEYKNEFPCGSHCKSCGNFWID